MVTKIIVVGLFGLELYLYIAYKLSFAGKIVKLLKVEAFR